MKVKIVNKSSNPSPAYATLQSAGMDIRANLQESVTLAPLQRALIPTGIYIALPEGFECQARPRSGLAVKHGITVLISSHILDELSRLATHYGFIDRGHILQEISADELNNRCRSAHRVTVSDTSLLAKTLDEMQLEYKVYSPQEADIFTQVKVTPLVLELNKNGCEVITMTERHESLENYFMGLVGGGAING